MEPYGAMGLGERIPGAGPRNIISLSSALKKKKIPTPGIGKHPREQGKFAFYDILLLKDGKMFIRDMKILNFKTKSRSRLT